ncbi:MULTISPECIES: cytochrome c oxidase subunit 3 [unclassified Mesorhizobium]|uniref:cytochrome c oxidase subunit 3 n=1 Tax=unclassified Mesorhizobium TaxID=325217 RepID=UPI000FD35736|nr:MULTISPECIES: cytochrome c oxidase subunit 3 [unclassified Mesorhizobium]RVD17718.1 cytochrome C oxidase subunit III [Mesorhizobium sp. M7A.F.Ca.ET.027.02.1.1]RWD09191.1 MAG: cytochrome C oxidase subunit III [Mesorhizobium sp.]RWP09687.1 MAG: cytochrome C oxidase subunit III [Mesorhizobium sp.]RWP86064.1 MAG: cytochrome C oxidase subunit III [Mesorhizobium sp.]RWQ14377.1 MAG: cytochrome C oxidase subunit III [Mesorhizobium sp.]
MKHRIAADLSGLPTFGHGPHSPTWWGTLGFMALEGTGFALAAGAYLYLALSWPAWRVSAPQPNHWPGTIVTILFVASLVPNHVLHRHAKQCSMVPVRIGLVVMSLLGIAPLVVRWFEFPALNIYWDTNAYGSMLWVLLGLHTTHLITDVGDTIVLTVLMFTRHGYSGRRFGDVGDNVFYWDFVVLTWIPIYVLIYWAPRLG